MNSLAQINLFLFKNNYSKFYNSLKSIAMYTSTLSTFGVKSINRELILSCIETKTNASKKDQQLLCFLSNKKCNSLSL